MVSATSGRSVGPDPETCRSSVDENAGLGDILARRRSAAVIVGVGTGEGVGVAVGVAVAVAVGTRKSIPAGCGKCAA